MKIAPKVSSKKLPQIYYCLKRGLLTANIGRKPIHERKQMINQQAFGELKNVAHNHEHVLSNKENCSTGFMSTNLKSANFKELKHKKESDTNQKLQEHKLYPIDIYQDELDISNHAHYKYKGNL